jgi:hypothetical protein
MGCGGSEEKNSGVVVEQKSASVQAIEAYIKKDKEGKWVWDLYEAWDVSGDPSQIKTADGKNRMSWPKPWAELEATIKDELKVDEKILNAMGDELINNEDLPHITAESVTWPAIQNLIRKCWVGANGDWDAKIQADKNEYIGLLRVNTLKAKKDGLSKMLKEMGQEKFLAEMWEIYVAWPNPLGEEAEVTRYNRKKAKLGEMVDEPKKTWPLAWDAVEGLMKSEAVGWSDEQCAALKTQLFDCKDESGVHPNCTEAEVCWPDLQQVFRSVVEEDTWDDDNDKEWDALAAKVTLRLKIPEEKVEEMLNGEWRMYCKPDAGEPFSYGLIIKDASWEAKTFSGSARTEGKYVVENGKVLYHEKRGTVVITYEEVWPNGQRDALRARVKSNGKFQCESAGGFEQKATREDINLPADPEERVGDGAKDKVKKYYLYDNDAAADA